MTKYASFGVELQLGDGAASEVFATVGQLEEIGGIPLSQDTEEVTTHDSTNRWEEFVKTVRRTGEIPGVVVWDPAEATHDNSSGILAELNSDEASNWKVVFPDSGSTEWAISGLLVQFEPTGFTTTGAMRVNFAIKPTGEPTLA